MFGRPYHLDAYPAGVRQDEFFDHNSHDTWAKLIEHEHANVIGQCFNEFPASCLANRLDRLADGKIVNGFSQVVGCSACPEVVGQLDGDEKPLRLSSFLVRHANMKPNLQVLDSYKVRHRWELLSWPLRLSSSMRVGRFRSSCSASGSLTQRYACASSLSVTSVSPATRHV